MSTPGIDIITAELLGELADKQLKAEHGQYAEGASWLCMERWGSLDVDDVFFYCPKDWNTSLWNRWINLPHLQRLAIAGALISKEIERLNHLKK